MALILDGTTGVPVTTVTGTLPVANGGTGVTTKTGTGAVVLGTAPTITGATITVAATAAPAFSAYQSTAQSLTANTITKLQLQTEEFDTNNNFASNTFTPTVAGYYQVSGAFYAIANRTYNIIYVYKNGAAFKVSHAGDSTTCTGASISALVYCNGTTDYIDLYGLTGVTQNTSITDTWFQAAMVRSA